MSFLKPHSSFGNVQIIIPACTRLRSHLKAARRGGSQPPGQCPGQNRVSWGLRGRGLLEMLFQRVWLSPEGPQLSPTLCSPQTGNT